MELLDLEYNKEINNDVASVLMNCLNNVKDLRIGGCNISTAMKRKVLKRGEEFGCSIVI